MQKNLLKIQSESFENPETKKQRLKNRRFTRKSIFADILQDSDVQTGDPLQKRIEEVFSLFDSGNKGEIDVRELGTVVRALGCVVTEAELSQIQEQVEEVENSCVSQDRFVEFMHKAIMEQKYTPPDVDTLLKAFKVFDPENRGYIMKEDLEKAIMECGEPFTSEELHDMMNVACDPQTGRINYEQYMNLLIDKTPIEKNVYNLAESTQFSKKIAHLQFKNEDYQNDSLKV